MSEPDMTYYNNVHNELEKEICASFSELGLGHHADHRQQSLSSEVSVKTAAKRAFDVVFGILMILFSLPVFSVIAVWIKIDSLGPVFFRQRRVGIRGRFFSIFKFRTMKQDNSELDHREYIRTLFKDQEKLEQNEVNLDQVEKYMAYLEKKTTRSGNLLRKTSLDELPQLFNIISGSMSFVGPRPHPVYEVQEYKKWYLRRLDVKPGLAGWSKLKLRMTPENYEEAILYDLWYVDNWSIPLDMKILFLTVPHVLLQRGAH